MTEENGKPRGRRRGGRARAQKAGGTLANLHGKKIVVEEDRSDEPKQQRVKATSSLRPRLSPDVTAARREEVVETKVGGAPAGKEATIAMKVEPTQGPKNISTSPPPSKPTMSINKAAATPPRTGKENVGNKYDSPAGVERPNLVSSAAESSMATPPLTSFKMKADRGNFSSNDDNLLSPLSPISAYRDRKSVV